MANAKCDASEFVICERNLEGRSVQVCFRIPPLMDRTLDEILESCKFPFGTRDDLLRWCLHHGMESLESKQSTSGIMPVLSLSLLLTRIDLQLETLAKFFMKVDAVMLQLSTHGHLQERARRLIKAIEQLILCIPSSNDRCLYYGELKRRWDHLLREYEPAKAADAKAGSGKGPTDESR